MSYDYNIQSIMSEYHRKQKYRKTDVEQFKDQKCKKCKNKKTNKCDIRRDIDGNLKCIYNEIS